MLIRTKLLAPDSTNPTYRVGLPNSTLLHGNIDTGIAIALIPDDDYPSSDDGERDGEFEQTTEGPILVSLSDDGHKKWHDYLAEKYKGHRTDFRPEVV